MGCPANSRDHLAKVNLAIFTLKFLVHPLNAPTRFLILVLPIEQQFGQKLGEGFAGAALHCSLVCSMDASRTQHRLGRGLVWSGSGKERTRLYCGNIKRQLHGQEVRVHRVRTGYTQNTHRVHRVYTGYTHTEYAQLGYSSLELQVHVCMCMQ